MLLKIKNEIEILGTAEEIWAYASNPANWTASNPTEHYGLIYDSPDNRPATDVTFWQRESVAGIMADLRGHFLYVNHPALAVWRGVATYKLFLGVLRPRIPEGGVITIVSSGGGMKLSHNVYMDFPDTWFGHLMLYVFKRWMNGEDAVRSHTFRELEFFKKQIETQCRGKT
ncbi:MAG: hypothetical protein ABIZ04_24090 [Opitutus sp.]